MNKKLLSLVSISAIMLAGCSLKFEPGFDNNFSSGMENGSNGAVIYNYIEGHDLGDLSSMTKCTIQMKHENSTADFSDVETLKKYIEDNDSIISNIDNFALLAKNIAGLRIGSKNENNLGELKISFTRSFSKIKIYATPYKGITESLEGSKITVDETAALKVNKLGYIKLNSTLDSDNNLTTTECNFNLGDDLSSVTIYSGPQRAIIDKIELFY